MQGAGSQRGARQQRMIVALNNDEGVSARVLGGNVPGLLSPAFLAPDLQALALT